MIGRRRAETGEKAKAKAKEKAEEVAMVADLAKTDDRGRSRKLLRTC